MSFWATRRRRGAKNLRSRGT